MTYKTETEAVRECRDELCDVVNNGDQIKALSKVYWAGYRAGRASEGVDVDTEMGSLS